MSDISISSNNEDEDEREEGIPPMVGSPTKSRASRTTISTVSDNENGSSTDNEEARGAGGRNLNQGPPLRHIHLLEPPPAQPQGKKPKILTKKQVSDPVAIPACCVNKRTGNAAKNHKGCFKALKDANEKVKSNGLVADQQNEELRTLFDERKTEVEGLRRFARSQYNKGLKIVKENKEGEMKLEAKVEREKKLTRVARKERDETVDEMKAVKSENRKLKSKFNTLEVKYNGLKAAPRVTPNKKMELSHEAKMVMEREKADLKLQCQMKKAEHQDLLQDRKEQRRNKQKEDRGKIGLGILGTGGQLNGSFMSQFMKAADKSKKKKSKKSKKKKKKRKSPSPPSSSSDSSTSSSDSSSSSSSEEVSMKKKKRKKLMKKLQKMKEMDGSFVPAASVAGGGPYTHAASSNASSLYPSAGAADGGSHLHAASVQGAAFPSYGFEISTSHQQVPITPQPAGGLAMLTAAVASIHGQEDDTNAD